MDKDFGALLTNNAIKTVFDLFRVYILGCSCVATSIWFYLNSPSRPRNRVAYLIRYSQYILFISSSPIFFSIFFIHSKMAPSKNLESWVHSRQNGSEGKSSRRVSATSQHRPVITHASRGDTHNSKQNNERPSNFQQPIEGGARNAWWKHLADKVSVEQSRTSRQPRPRLIGPPIQTGSSSLTPQPMQKAFESALFAVPTSPKIDRRNLGSAAEALHSHPTSTWFESSGFLQSNMGIKKQHRKVAICERDEDDYVLIQPSELSTDLLAEHRQGRMLPREARGTSQEFPQFRSSGTNEKERVEQTVGSTIPIITLTSPPEGDIDQVDSTFLSVKEAYEILLKRSNKEIRRLRPLAWLVAETEGINIRNTTALVEALEEIINDREKLSKLLPLAAALCKDQGIDLNAEAFESLPRVLDQVLKERREAKFAALHNKRAKHSLECRVSRLEAQLSELRYDGDEDYIR
jgi:hypothetical protein